MTELSPKTEEAFKQCIALFEQDILVIKKALEGGISPEQLRVYINSTMRKNRTKTD